MSGEWLDDLGFEVHKVPDNCGTYTDPGGGRKMTAHTTESPWGSTDALIRLFMDSVLNAPQFQIDWNNGKPRFVQYLGLHRAGCALKGCGGGCPTNGAGVNVQVEIVGYARETHTWPDEVLRMIADYAVKVNVGLKRIGYAEIPYETTVKFWGAGEGVVHASPNSPVRLSCNNFLSYVGWLGHQHVPCNDHWDPGALNVPRILEIARSIDAGDEFMSDTQYQAVMASLNNLSNEMSQQTATLGSWMKDGRNLIGGAALKKPGDDRQWLLAITEAGLVKYPIGRVADTVKVIGTVEKDLMVKSEMVRDAINLIELTDANEIKVLDAIPITLAPPAPKS